MKSNSMMYLAVAAGAFFLLKNQDSGNGKAATATTATNQDEPETTSAWKKWSRNYEFNAAEEETLLNLILSAHGLSPEGTLPKARTDEELKALGIDPVGASHSARWNITEGKFQAVIMTIDEAIAWYSNRPQGFLEMTRGDVIAYKEQLVLSIDGIAMGPISGFSGVY